MTDINYNTVESVVQVTIDKYSFSPVSHRVQDTVYLIDAHYFDKYNQRLIDVNWLSHLYGSHSEKVEYTLNNSEYITTNLTVPDDRNVLNNSLFVTKYSCNNTTRLRDNAEKVCSQVVKKAENWDDSELCDIVRTTNRYLSSDELIEIEQDSKSSTHKSFTDWIE